MELINQELFDRVSKAAKESSRLRMNHNFHDSLNAPAQRLLNALQPGTVLPIHRHTNTSETYILLQGRLSVLFYNDKKELIQSAFLDPKQGNFGIHIPKGQWHTVEVLANDTIIFEVKDGPYTPLDENNILN